ICAEEDLAQVISDVQDLGLRVTLVHITVDGNWTISRALRQEADDLIEIGGEHLRPYVELIAGAEPALDELDTSAARSNGHLAGVGASAYQQSGNHAPPAIYTAPVVAEYQRPALQLPRASAPAEPAAADLTPGGTAQAQLRRLPTRAARDQREPREQRDREQRDREQRDREPRDREPRELRESLQVREARDTREPWDVRESRDSRESWEPRESRDYAPAPVHPAARSAPYSGPQPVMPPGYAASQQQTVSLSDAVQAAHEEGQDFGESVARDAPALWLEAVLARKPRMPSDLEARLLQGSALPIDFLLHDEVRHALRRGFWDALERTRR
ncbi:MAG TPA: NYN domain-containing protein, partial [Streptosporangiaceae bacterium]|nr:NYN domain-containing protein [Streptosporangiaceae bacterium]